MAHDQKGIFHIVHGNVPEACRAQFLAAAGQFASTHAQAPFGLKRVAEDVLERGLVYLISTYANRQAFDSSQSCINEDMIAAGYVPTKSLAIRISSPEVVPRIDLKKLAQPSQRTMIAEYDQAGFVAFLIGRVGQQNRDLYIESARTSVPAGRANGAVAYIIASDVLDPNGIVIVEAWGTGSAFQNHVGAGYHHQRVKDLAAMNFQSEGGVRFAALSWQWNLGSGPKSTLGIE